MKKIYYVNSNKKRSGKHTNNRENRFYDNNSHMRYVTIFKIVKWLIHQENIQNLNICM